MSYQEFQLIRIGKFKALVMISHGRKKAHHKTIVFPLDFIFMVKFSKNKPPSLHLSTRMGNNLRQMTSDSYLPLSYLCCHKCFLVHTFCMEFIQFCYSFLELFLREKLDEESLLNVIIHKHLKGILVL